MTSTVQLSCRALDGLSIWVPTLGIRAYIFCPNMQMQTLWPLSRTLAITHSAAATWNLLAHASRLFMEQLGRSARTWCLTGALLETAGRGQHKCVPRPTQKHGRSPIM